MKVLLIEDETLIAEKMKKLLYELDPGMEVVAVLGSVAESVAWLKQNAMPQIIFMDIELSDGKSLEIFNSVAIKCPVIFVTSYDEYALEAFKVNSIDYILKPVRKEDLRNAIGKYYSLVSFVSSGQADRSPAPAEKMAGDPPYRKRFLSRTGNRMISVDVNEIAYFFVRDRVVFLRSFSGSKLLIDYTLEEIETMVNPVDFFRLNRSVLANIKAIESITANSSGKLIVNVAPAFDEPVFVSRLKANEFKVWVGK